MFFNFEIISSLPVYSNKVVCDFIRMRKYAYILCKSDLN